jgi:DNA processing protein
MNSLIQQIIEQSIEVVPSIQQFKQADITIIKNQSWQDEYNLLITNNIQYITYQDALYPPELLQYNDSPACLFYRGNINLINQDKIAIIGSRAVDKYSTNLISAIIPTIKRPIVSGLALGTDIQVHISALESITPCIAVLPSGLLDKSIVPRSNHETALRIIENNGLLISQFLPTAQAKRYSYIVRNKTLVKISQDIWVVKAALASGSMTTANIAMEYKKNVYTSIHNIFEPSYAGNIELINRGAKIVSRTNLWGVTPSQTQCSDSQLLQLVRSGINDIDTILETLDRSVFNRELATLTLSNQIYQDDNALYIVS